MSSWRRCSLTSLHHSTRLVAKVAEAGFEAELALNGSGLRLSDLNDLGTKLQIVDEYTIYRNAISLLPWRSLSVEIGLAARVSVYGFLGYALQTAPTLRAALSIAANFPALIANGFVLSVEDSGNGRAAIVFDSYNGAHDLRTPYAELAVSSFKRSCSDIMGRDLPLLGVTFQGKETVEHTQRCAQLLECRVTHHQPGNRMEFEALYLDYPLPLADPVSHQEVLQACQRQNSEYAAEREWLVQVKTILESSLQEPLSLEGVAKRMHCSARTLRRQLNLLKTSYRQLLDDVRFEKAKAMLKQGTYPTDQIAEMLGFCDGGGFRRAFQRWSGHAPGAYKS